MVAEDLSKLIPDNRLENTNETTLRQAQLILLRTLRIVDHVCRENGIKYWLDGGTLLGAVRDGSFIPWDDDVDISMAREDYEKFNRIAVQELPEDLFVQNYENTGFAGNPWTQIKDRKSHMKIGYGATYHQGIYLDIFPCDSFSENPLRRIFKEKIYKLLYIKVQAINAPLKKPYFQGENIIKNIIKILLKIIFFECIFFDYEFIANLSLKTREKRINSMKKNPKTNYGYGTDILNWENIYRAEDIFPLKTIKFEGFEFFAPNNCHSYLTNLYDSTYMQLPPENKRVYHNIELNTVLSKEEEEEQNRRFQYKAKSRILHIVATGTLSGAEKVVSDICTNLNPEKLDIITVVAGEELQNYYSSKGLKSTIIDISKLNIFEIQKLRKLIKFEKVDIIHAHDVKASVASALAVRGLNVPVISHLHGNYLWLESNYIMKFIDAHFRKKYCLSIACSDQVEQYYKANNYNFDYNKMIVMGNAFNFQEFNKIKLQDKEEFKKKNGIPQHKYIFGYVGRLIKLKGVDIIIKSFEKLSKKNSEAILIIVGEGEEKDHLIKLVDRLSLQDKVILMGYRWEIYDFMNIFDAFVVASEIEGLPMVILEAMAMEKLIISTPVGGIPEVIKHGVTGLLIKERNEEALLESLEYAYNNRNISQSLGNEARKFLENNRNILKYVKRLEEIYKNNGCIYNN